MQRHSGSVLPMTRQDDEDDKERKDLVATRLLSPQILALVIVVTCGVTLMVFSLVHSPSSSPELKAHRPASELDGTHFEDTATQDAAEIAARNVHMAPFKEEAEEMTLENLLKKNLQLRMTMDAAKRLVRVEDQRLSQLTGVENGDASALIPAIPEEAPQDVEGLARENANLMDILEAVRKFVNAEEGIAATEQQAEKKIMLGELQGPKDVEEWLKQHPASSP